LRKWRRGESSLYFKPSIVDVGECRTAPAALAKTAQ